MKLCYKDKKFTRPSLEVVEQINEIVDEYADMGFTLTLRQLYYQFVSRDLVQNTESSYNRIGRILSEGRMAGLISWQAVVDRTRNLQAWTSYDGPDDAVEQAIERYDIDWWKDQWNYVEVWVEKEALAEVMQRACSMYRVPFFSCKGYVSASEEHAAAMRFQQKVLDGKHVQVIHLGDHDPSGIDMTRDNEDRIRLFMEAQEECFHIHRIALNFDQIQEYEPPPNFAKDTDSRYGSYAEKYGEDSWELDALDPNILVELVQDEIARHIDDEIWSADQERYQLELATLTRVVTGLRDD